MSRRRNKSFRGRLLKGILENVPNEVFEIVKPDLQKIMRRYAGIYALYKGKKLYYVGLTRYLHGRLISHLIRDSHAGNWDNFSVFMIKRVDYLKDLETLVLRIANPKGNRTRGKIPQHGQLKKELRQRLADYVSKAKKIRKRLW